MFIKVSKQVCVCFIKDCEDTVKRIIKYLKEKEVGKKIKLRMKIRL